MRKKAKKLEFVSRIKADGSGTEKVPESLLKNDLFLNKKLKITCLSISEGTYIASGFNSFVVKLK
jgi:hypothetical protein